MVAGSRSPAVSIIIPTYNRAAYIGRAIRSVLAQTFQDWELIVVDDGSTDNTEEVLRGLTDSRIRYFRHQENRGAGAARNTGIRKARGTYITFLDSDDEFLPVKLAHQVQFISSSPNANLEAVGCGACIIDAGLIRRVRWFPTGQLYDNLLSLKTDHRFFFHLNALLIKKEAMQRHDLFFDENMRTGQDRDLILRLVSACQFACIDQPLVNIHSDATNRNTDENNASVQLSSRLVKLHKYEHELRRRPKALADHHMSIALLYWRVKDFHAMRSHLKKAVMAWPSAQSIAYLVFSLLGRRVFGFAYGIKTMLLK